MGIKYPRYFLNEKLDNIWKLFKRKQLSLNLFVSKENLDLGVLPNGVLSSADSTPPHINLFDDEDLNRFLNTVEIKDNSVTFIELDDYHFVAGDIHYKLQGLDFLYETVGGEIDLIFDKLDRDNFDIVLIFSDHGCLLEKDKPVLWHRGRIQTYLQLWIKNSGIDELNRDERLCSCMDIFPTLAFLLEDFVLNRTDGLNLLTNAQHPFLVIEDYLNFSVTLDQALGWWGIMFPNFSVQTDSYDNWYIDDERIQFAPELKEVFTTILKNYVSDYEENVKGQRILNKYKELTAKAEEKQANKVAFYNNGKERIAFPNNAE